CPTLTAGPDERAVATEALQLGTQCWMPALLARCIKRLGAPPVTRRRDCDYSATRLHHPRESVGVAVQRELAVRVNHYSNGPGTIAHRAGQLTAATPAVTEEAAAGS